jgi:hypothetical protein
MHADIIDREMHYRELLDIDINEKLYREHIKQRKEEENENIATNSN